VNVTEPYRPEFVEVAIAPHVEGPCAWCGATIRYPGDQSSAECPRCHAQSTRALAPPKTQRRKVFAMAAPPPPPESSPAPAPITRAEVATTEPWQGASYYVDADLGRVVLPVALALIGVAVAAVALFPAIGILGPSGVLASGVLGALVIAALVARGAR
jgi:hypothetical protein